MAAYSPTTLLSPVWAVKVSVIIQTLSASITATRAARHHPAGLPGDIFIGTCGEGRQNPCLYSNANGYFYNYECNFKSRD